MKAKKEKLTREELSRVRSENAKRGAETRKRLGLCRGGRPKGSTKDPSLKSIPPRSLTIREPDYHVFRKFAYQKEIPIAEAMHRVAASLLKNHPDLKPENWVD